MPVTACLRTDRHRDRNFPRSGRHDRQNSANWPVTNTIEAMVHSGRKSCCFGLIALVLLATCCNAQSTEGIDNLPASPSAVNTPASSPAKVNEVATHRFWDRENILLFSGVAVVRGMDYASTRNFMARGRQEILLPDDVVNNSAGFAALEAAATMTSVGISYIFHRTGHHKMERWLSVGHIGVTAFGVIRNYSLESAHTKTVP